LRLCDPGAGTELPCRDAAAAAAACVCAREDSNL
jgi:hypothetical protein